LSLSNAESRHLGVSTNHTCAGKPGQPGYLERKRIVILASLALGAVALLFFVAAQRANPEIAVERDLIYGKDADTDLKLDLALPKAGDGPFPAVVFLHGEGWRVGNRQQMNHFIEGMARLGYVGINVDVPFPGGSFAEKPDVYKRASPITYVTRGAPPFLFLHGTDDKLVPVDQSKRLAEKLKNFGVPTRMVALEGEGRGFTAANNQKSMQQMLDFLGERLKK
jgi:acetyl esterase/lipase